MASFPNWKTNILCFSDVDAPPPLPQRPRKSDAAKAAVKSAGPLNRKELPAKPETGSSASGPRLTSIPSEEAPQLPALSRPSVCGDIHVVVAAAEAAVVV